MGPHALQIFGEIETKLGLHGLSKRLARAGLHVEIRESCHYQGGRYLRVYKDEELELMLERIQAREYLIQADAAPFERIQTLASRLSRALADLRIRHRFELYSEGRNELVHYFHHLWPQAHG